MIKILKPANDGLKVFNPATRLPLNPNGEEVGMSNYWYKILSCGDVVEVTPSAPEKKEIKKTIQKNNSED